MTVATLQKQVTALIAQVNDLANRITSLEAKVTALIAAPNAPPAPVALAVTFFDSTNINLDWGDAPPTGLISYTLYQSIADAAFVALPPFTGSPPSSNASISGLTPGTKYNYYVVSTNSFGTSAPSNVVTRTTTGADTTPDQFTFVDQNGVALNTVVISAPITVTGINAATLISVSNGSYSINGGAFTNLQGTVNNNDQVRAQHTSSSLNSTNTNTPVTIGGVLDTFTSTTLAPAGTTIATFTLASAAGGTLLPFTAGHAFRQGDVPSGQFLTSTLANFQADIRNRWPDGSIKFAVLSGRQTLSPNVAVSIPVQSTSTAPAGTNLTQANLISTGATAAMQLPPFGTATLDITTAPFRSMLGVQMSEFHFRQSVGADPHLVVWWYVRLYQGGFVEIETCVENGYMKVASPADKTYTATLFVGGVQRFTQANLVHYQRTRWMTINWLDGSSGQTDFSRVVPAHDHAYLRSTKLIPNYSTAATPTAAYLNSLGQSIVPMGNGPYANDDLGSTGAAGHIGLLPQWEAAYCLSADSRALKAVVAYTYAGNGQQAFYRDESTQCPLALTTRPNLDAAGWNVDPVVSGSTSNGRIYDDGTQAHAPSVGYLGYLITGRWTHLESAAFWAARSHMHINPQTRGLASNNGGGATTPRGRQERQKAWHMRSAQQVAAIYPDTCPTAADQLVRDNWIAALGQTFIYMRDNWRTNNLGYPDDIFNPDSTLGETPGWPAGTLCSKAWMMEFLVQAIGFGWDLGLSYSTAGSAHQLVRDYFYQWPVGMYGAPGSGWDYRNGLPYIASIGTYISGGARTWDASFTAAYARQLSMPNLPSVNLVASLPAYPANTAILSGHFNDPDASSYGGNMMPAIVYAADHAAAGANASYNRLLNASNYAAFIANQPIAPQWATIPRVTIPSGNSLLAQVAAAMPAKTWIEFDGAIHSILPGVPLTLPLNYQAQWASAAAAPDGYFAYATEGTWNPITKHIEFFGGGHGSDAEFFEIREAEWDSQEYPNNIPANPGHGNDSTIVNPFTGDVFYREAQSGTFGVRKYAVGVYTSFTYIAQCPANQELMGGTTWWTTGLSGVGAQGALVLVRSKDGLASALIWDPLTNAWSSQITVPNYNIGNGNGDQNCCGAWSQPKNCFVFGGFNSASKRVWRMDSDRSITQITDAPTSNGIGVTRAPFIADPATGNFLVNHREGFYEINPTTGVWRLINAANGYQDRPSTVNTNDTLGNGTPGVIGITLPEHGVTAWFSVTGTTGRIHLYKHG